MRIPFDDLPGHLSTDMGARHSVYKKFAAKVKAAIAKNIDIH